MAGQPPPTGEGMSVRFQDVAGRPFQAGRGRFRFGWGWAVEEPPDVHVGMFRPDTGRIGRRLVFWHLFAGRHPVAGWLPAVAASVLVVLVSGIGWWWTGCLTVLARAALNLVGSAAVRNASVRTMTMRPVGDCTFRFVDKLAETESQPQNKPALLREAYNMLPDDRRR